MPFVNIKNAGKLTKEKKAELGDKVADVVSAVLGKPKEHVWVQIDDLERENWVLGGKQLE